MEYEEEPVTSLLIVLHTSWLSPVFQDAERDDEVFANQGAFTFIPGPSATKS